ncbi:MAG: orotidine-5'-phosphate decarboxylase [Candidatus Ancillula sp.]|jgi:orotidine-5'-phosphate decarboxylase|nr:orotidine-5'-phosphate decarboxylase [Candidatus Ancillula sp.]
MSTSLWSKIIDEVDGERICLGIDPHSALLESWGLGDTGPDLYTFGESVLDSFDESMIIALKPQSAFFEAQGSKGVKALEDLLQSANARQIPTILDVKRGDIGSTMQGYARAYLSEESALKADAVTISPYLGVKSLEETAKYALKNGRGIFVLCLTSNPESYGIQHAKTEGGQSVAKEIFDWAKDFNERFEPTVGLVVGATIGDGAKAAGIDFDGFNAPILSPGVGAQGAGAKEVRAVFGEACTKVLPSVSRAILKAGPEVADMIEATSKVVKELKDE